LVKGLKGDNNYWIHTKINTNAIIRLPLLDREISLSFTPNEIKTILVPRDKEKPILEVNLLELDSSGTY
jgi:hypothetical protein